MTPPTLFAIKHLLQLNKSCKFIEVKVDSIVANAPFETYRALLPKFVVSQLEEQRLTEKDSEKVPVPPVAAFVIQSLPSASGRDSLYPTLFRWYYPPLHRTYYLFAHINHSMARRTYTLTELMGLRANQASSKFMAMAGNPEIGMFYTCIVTSLAARLTNHRQPTLFAAREVRLLLVLALVPVADPRPPDTRTIHL